ncbi:MAG: cytochrome c oxidase assembly protein [Proteobacteria bacterium]|nr:cytochrome c oxidase assembly protein [Pseudomonadota bacterium]MDA1059640.1 cytochrome c oxidase assembly protein [Pseudomonadota bacterium]
MVDQSRRRFTGLLLGGVVVGMGGAAYAAVPAYRLFCQVTGFGGTTRRAHALPSVVGERMITVQFDANTDPALPWRFRPKQREVAVRVGAEGLAFYEAANLSNAVVMGQAAFNVSPAKAGQYFNKIQCFCFNEQVLQPGESANMPVTFFIDPAIVDDPNMDDVSTITLSYTFFRQDMSEEEIRKFRVSRTDGAPETKSNKIN